MVKSLILQHWDVMSTELVYNYYNDALLPGSKVYITETLRHNYIFKHLLQLAKHVILGY